MSLADVDCDRRPPYAGCAPAHRTPCSIRFCPREAPSMNRHTRRPRPSLIISAHTNPQIQRDRKAKRVESRADIADRCRNPMSRVTRCIRRPCTSGTERLIFARIDEILRASPAPPSSARDPPARHGREPYQVAAKNAIAVSRGRTFVVRTGCTGDQPPPVPVARESSRRDARRPPARLASPPTMRKYCGSTRSPSLRMLPWRPIPAM